MNKDVELGNITDFYFCNFIVPNLWAFLGMKKMMRRTGHTAKMLSTIAKASINNSVKGEANGKHVIACLKDYSANRLK